MWSDRIPPARLRQLATGLRSVLHAPSASAHKVDRDLAGGGSVEEVAERLNRCPGFCWLGGNRILHRPLATLSYSNGSGVVSGPRGNMKLAVGGFELLQAALEAWQGPSGAMLGGYLSYDLAAEIEELGPIPANDFAFPEFWFGLYDSALEFSEAGWSLSGTDAWRGGEALAVLSLDEAPLESSIEGTRLSNGCTTSRPDRRGFEAAVARIVARIHAGEIFQTNLCRRLDAPLQPGMDWELYRRLRCISPAQFEAFIRIDCERAILSVSPELFLRVRGNVVESSPIKGTRPRGESSEEDRGLADALAASEKDRAELAMIVDVARNDLARVCQPGSVEVVRHAALMTLPTVHHLFSTVRGRLREGNGPVELLRAAFPAASITGAPKIEAMKIAMREEGQLRGPCMGAIGWISMDGDMELSVAIRTAFTGYGRVRYYAGCGITAESVPADEYAESEHKAAAFLRALDVKV